MPYSGEETNKKLGALTTVTEELAESNKKLVDASFAEESDNDGSSESKALSVVVVGGGAGDGATKSKINLSGVGAGQQKEIEQEKDKPEPDEVKRNTLLKKMAGYMGDQAKNAKKIAMTGIKGFLSTVAIGGFLILLGKFLQSDSFKKMIDTIKKDIMPYMETVWEWMKTIGTFIKDNLTHLLIGLGAYFTLKGAVSLYVEFNRMKKIFAGLKALQLANLASSAGSIAGPAAAGAAGGGIWARAASKVKLLTKAITGRAGLMLALGGGKLGLIGKIAMMSGGLAVAGIAMYGLYKAGQWMSDQSTKVDLKQIGEAGQVIAKGDKASDEELEGARQRLQSIMNRQSQLADNENNRKVQAANKEKMDLLLAELKKREKKKPPPVVKGMDTKDLTKNISAAFTSAIKSTAFKDTDTAEQRIATMTGIGDEIFQRFIMTPGFREFDTKKQKEILTSFWMQEQSMLRNRTLRLRASEGLKAGPGASDKEIAAGRGAVSKVKGFGTDQGAADVL